MRILQFLLMVAGACVCQDLRWFLQEGRYDQAREFLKAGGDVDAKRQGVGPLHWAARTRNLDAARFLVEHGADLEDLDMDECTPLLVASGIGDLEMVRFLVGKGARMDAFSEWGRNPLSTAIRARKDSVVDFLLQRMADPFVEPGRRLPNQRSHFDALFEAVGMGDTATFRKLFPRRPDPNARTERGRTLLMAAVEANSMALVGQLVALGADPSAADPSGNTALHLACQGGADSSILESLLEIGADPHRKNRDGQRPLHLAAESKSLANARVLLGRGVDVEARDRHGDRPFEIAMDNGQEGIAMLLAGKGARPVVETREEGLEGIRVSDWQPAFAKQALLAGWDPDGPVYPGRFAFEGGRETFLTLAARNGWRDVLELALSKGADPFQENSRRGNAFQVALECERFESFHILRRGYGQGESREATEALRKLVARDDTGGGISILMRSGARIDGRDESGRTALMIAAGNGLAMNVKVLLKWKGDPTLRDRTGRSALHHALGSGCFECLRSLVEKGASPGDAFAAPLSLVSLALESQDTAAAAYLVKKGAPPQLAEKAYPKVFGDGDARTSMLAMRWIPSLDLDRALLEAARSDHVAVVERLIDRGADVNASDKEGSTPLILACTHGSDEVVELLIKRGARKHLKNRKGVSGEFACDSRNGD